MCGPPPHLLGMHNDFEVSHMQLACTLTFEAVHGESCDQGINHPNQYYSDSKKIMESRVIIHKLKI